MTRLLVLTTSYPLRNGASSGVFVKRLLESLPAKFEATVVTPADSLPRGPDNQSGPALLAFRYAPRCWQRLAQNPGGVMPALKESPTLLLLLPVMLLAMSFQTLRLARRSDLVFANWAICGVIGGAVGRLLGKPTVLVLRGDDVTLARSSPLQRYLLHCAVNWNDRIVCVAESMKAALQALSPGSESRISTVLNGVGEEFLQLSPRTASAEEVIILAVGSLIPRKGYDVLLEALARLRGHAYRLLIAGDGPERRRLELQARDGGLGERVSFLGEVAPDEVPKLMGKAEIFVLASRSEGRSNVVLEAMAAGLAVIASGIPGVTDLLEHGSSGWLFAAGDAGALAAALGEAITDCGERVRRARGARERVLRSGWTWPAAGQKYASIFADALAGTETSG